MYIPSQNDELNEKLYKSGHYVDTLTSDPIEIAREYAAAGVDVSHYSPIDLVRAHEEYSNYSYNAKKEAEEKRREAEEKQAELEREREEEKARAEYEEQLEYEEEMAEYDAWMREKEQTERELNEKFGYVYTDQFSTEEERYLKALYNFPEELYDYLASKGAYEEETEYSYKHLDYTFGTEVSENTRMVNTKQELFINQKLIRKNPHTGEMIYDYWCRLAERFEHDLPYFDYEEWQSIVAPKEHLSKLLSEYEMLQQMSEHIEKEPEEIATVAFREIKSDVDRFKQTYKAPSRRMKLLDYRSSRALAFYYNPKALTNKFEEIMKKILY